MKDIRPIISIIIPVYKVEKFIHKCLDSIIAQTYTNWEAILVDDGSPDNCGIICDEYAAKDKRFKVIHQENKGVVNARNSALKIAKGGYLAFVDSDDYIEQEMLEEMITMAINEKKDIVWCNLQEIYKDYSSPEIICIDYNNDTNIRNLLNRSLPGYLWNKLIYKPFWDKCDIKTDENAVMCEDTLISLQLLSNNPNNGIINKTFYNYIKTNANAATCRNEESIIVRAKDNIIHIYNYLKEKGLLNKFYEEFSSLALKLKIEMLRNNIELAIELFPFAHQNFNNFKFQFPISLFYWLGFNCKSFGKLLFKIHFRKSL